MPNIRKLTKICHVKLLKPYYEHVLSEAAQKNSALFANYSRSVLEEEQMSSEGFLQQ